MKPKGLKKLKLYWATTEDHDEDWFIVATGEKHAARLHENLEGYDRGDAEAEFVSDIPDDLQEGLERGWAEIELLRALGATFISEHPSNVVELNGRQYCQGMLDGIIMELNDDLFEAKGQGRPNKTESASKTIH